MWASVDGDRLSVADRLPPSHRPQQPAVPGL
jgi:hypothetical protein